MIKLIKDIFFAWKYKRAVRKAKKMSALFKMKYYVLSMGGRIKVVPKQNIRHLVRTHRFRKGVKVADIEKIALYVTT
ncbi:hypothetical protein HMPREF1640_03455 [Prevotella sp. S7-1-8]|uniref:hypothetical protein n=1 Tax=Prevotella sp. S7-1-8 TaxID=1284775 RepID=UPI00050FF83A|nr:hypothetical protein [Prevotella sp. S7-1-8]KGF18519.1 hypothetical protein HMPREF1640_03455 [Prevotella sp. S7-1-8]